MREQHLLGRGRPTPTSTEHDDRLVLVAADGRDDLGDAGLDLVVGDQQRVRQALLGELGRRADVEQERTFGDEAVGELGVSVGQGHGGDDASEATRASRDQTRGITARAGLDKTPPRPSPWERMSKPHGLPALFLAATLACSQGDATDAGASSSFGSGVVDDASDEANASESAGDEQDTSSDDSSDPCAGMTPCEDATGDIPITGAAGTALLPSNQVDLAAWAGVGMGGSAQMGDESSQTLTGTELGDLLDGLGGNDQLQGLGGDDWLRGGEGSDNIDAGDGNDRVEGENSIDTLQGGKGLDLVLGGAGDDTMFGGADADVLFGELQSDTILGEIGDDRLFGGEGNDELDAGDGNDQVWGELGDDTLAGSVGNDVLIGGPGSDTLRGGSEDDVYVWQPGDGDDVIDGETVGADTLWIGGHSPGDLEALRAGDDYLLILPEARIRIVGFYTDTNILESIQTEL